MLDGELQLSHEVGVPEQVAQFGSQLLETTGVLMVAELEGLLEFSEAIGSLAEE